MKTSHLLRTFLNPITYTGLLFTVLAIIAAYQVRPTYDIQIGTPTDGPLLGNFNTPEVISGQKTITFRWTRAESDIIFQDVGQQDLDITLLVNGWRPPGQPPAHLKVQANNTTLLDLPHLSPDIKSYSFSVPREAVKDGTLYLRLSTNPFSPPGDKRTLGVALTRIKLSPSPATGGFLPPPTPPLLSVLLTVVLLGLTLALLGWGPGGVALGTGLVGGLAAWLVALDRFWLTSQGWYSAWPQLALIGSIIVILLWPLGSWLLRAGGTGWSAWQRRTLLTVILAAFLIRLAGQMHPQIWMPDVGFHVNRFNVVETGQLLFMTAPAEWGEHPTFYLPTPYIFMLPLQWFFHDKFFVVKLLTVTAGTLGTLPIFYIVKRITTNGRAALIAGALYLIMPMSVLPFSWCITSNLFGEFFTLSALAVAVGTYPHLKPTRPALYGLLAVLFVALLSHPGVVQQTAGAFTFISLLWLLWRRILGGKASRAVWTMSALLVAFGLAYLVYYANFAAGMLQTLGQISSERAAKAAGGGLHLQVGGSVEDNSLGLFQRIVETRRDWLLWGLRGFWQEAQAYYRVWPILGAAVGYVSIWPITGRRRWAGNSKGARLVLAALAWAFIAVIFALIGWVMNLYVRYMLFILPMVAIGGGILLSKLWQRSKAGTLLALLLLLFFTLEALALWHYRITFAFK